MKENDIRYDKVSTYIKLNKKTFIIASISGIIFNSLMALVPIIQGRLLDSFVDNKNIKYIIYFALTFLLFVLYVQFNRFLKRYFIRDFSNKMVLQMRRVCFKNMLLSDIKTFSLDTKGDIMNKNLQDIKDSAEGIRKVFTEIYDTIILLIGYFISMIYMSPTITLYVTGFIILSMIFAHSLKKIIYKNTKEYKKVFSKTKDETLYLLQNEVYYRGFGVSENYHNKYKETLNDLEKKSRKALIYKSSFEPLYQAVALIGLFFIIYFGGKNYLAGIWAIGTFQAYITTYALVSTKASKTGKLFNSFQSFKVSWNRVKPFLIMNNSYERLDIKNKDIALSVKDMSFGFDDKFSVKNITLELNEGEILGVCGKIHSGKSTFIASLCGLYDYSGSIKLLGYELKENRNKFIDNFITYSKSTNEIFSDIIKYNISFDKECQKDALEDSMIYDDINSFPNKDKEILSHSNVNLSGGQQKRLCMARCLNQNSYLTILDDPFNAIDISMAKRIVDNIKKRKHQMFVIVSNQKEILMKFDKILFLKEDGYIFSKYNEIKDNPEFLNMIGGN